MWLGGGCEEWMVGDKWEQAPGPIIKQNRGVIRSISHLEVGDSEGRCIVIENVLFMNKIFL